MRLDAVNECRKTRWREAWTQWRRLDWPKLVAPPDALTAFPVRLTYPVAEQTLNGANRAAASTAIGGDLVSTRLFWDTFPEL